MLVVSRKSNQSIIVDGPCRITVLKSSCKLGIEGSAKVLREELAPKESSTTSSPSIYLVDDDKDLLHAYQRYLSHFGFDVKSFSHGGEFLQHMQGEGDSSAVVLLDLRLTDQDIDGLQILQQLRAWNHDHPVILLTGYGDVDTCRRAFHGGCYTFLQKPLAPQDLVATIKEAASRYQRGEIGKRHAFSSLAG